jgi:RNA polymerase sigma factor (sigma-70 family)
MAEKKYYIRVPEALVEVTEEVYKAFWRMERHDKTLEEKDDRNHVFSYDALDTDDMLGAELIPDQSLSSMEDQVIAEIMAAKLRRCIALLPEEDQKLIQAIYYDGLSEEAVGQKFGISQPAISKKKDRILQKLQKFFNR